MGIIAVAFYLLQLASGRLWLRVFDPARRWSAPLRFAAAVVLGLFLSAYLTLALAVVTRSLLVAVATVAVLALASLLRECWRHGFRWPAWLGWRQLDWLRSGVFWLTAALVALAVVLELQVLLPAGTFLQAPTMAWGDVALHLGIIERLAVADPFQLQHPFFAGHPLAYPFLVDFLSALYRRLGAGAWLAYHLPAVTLSVAAVFLLVNFYRVLLGRRGPAVGLAALALLGAGLGWMWFGRDLRDAYRAGGFGAVAQTVISPPHEYTHLDDRTGGKPPGFDAPANIVWIVPVLSFLTHQRSFPLGLSVGLLVLLGVFAYRRSAVLPRFGVLAGLLPLAHGHTFLALGLAFSGVLLAAWREWREWLRFGVVTAILALPLVAYLLAGTRTAGPAGGWLAPWWGWMTCPHNQDWFACGNPPLPGTDTAAMVFWVKNFGGVFVAWVVAALSLLRPRPPAPATAAALPLLLPSLLLFAVPNLVRLQPWEFDNNKVLFWWWIFALAIVGRWLLAMPRPATRMTLAVLLTVVVLPAGLLDVTARLTRFTAFHSPYVAETELEAAAWIRQHLPPNAAVVTGTNPNNFVPMLTGRPIALGYPGWLWSEGFDSRERRQAIAALADGDAAPACRQELRYLVDDADFRRDFTVDDGRLAAVVQPLWRQPAATGVAREILRIQCPPR